MNPEKKDYIQNWLFRAREDIAVMNRLSDSEIEYDTGQIISPLVISRARWESKHKVTPFYQNVTKEGIQL